MYIIRLVRNEVKLLALFALVEAGSAAMACRRHRWHVSGPHLP